MLTSIAYIILLGLTLGLLFRLIKLPALIGMLLTGIILGPHCLDLLAPSLLSVSVELRQVALVIILLRAGLALDIHDLKKVGRPAIMMTCVPACFEILGITLLAPWLLGITWLEALVMGAVVSAVSPAVIVPKMLFLMENKIGTQKRIPQLIMAGGAVDDVFVIVLFTVFTSLAMGGTVESSSFLQIPVAIVTGLTLGIGSGWGLVRFFKRFHMRDSVKLLILMSFSFLFLALESHLKGTVPLSGLLGVMAMGATILKQYEPLAIRIAPKFSKLWVGAEILLFVLVGATVDLKYALAAGLAAAVLILGALIFRMVGVGASVSRTNLTWRERLFCMIAYTPKATVQAAIGSLPLAMGLPCGNMVLTVAVLSILITAPLGALGIDMTYKRLLHSEEGSTATNKEIPSDELSE